MSVISRLAERVDKLRSDIVRIPRRVREAVPDKVRQAMPDMRKPLFGAGSGRASQHTGKMRRPPEKTYTLFAGVNGAGKTSLYRILNKYEDLGVRVNIDEIVASEGYWKDDILQINASRKALRIIGECIDKGKSFNQETTLPTQTVVKQIKKARDAGYHIRLYFVGVENLETAIKRVHRRVEKGGHGVDEKLIRQRFEKLPETLRDVLPLVDTAFFYDNTVKFIQVALVRNNVIVDCENDIPVWFWELIAKARRGGRVK